MKSGDSDLKEMKAKLIEAAKKMKSMKDQQNELENQIQNLKHENAILK
jgi:cell division protein FtsB